MDVNIVAIAIFMLFSIFTPISLIATSIILRRRTKRNAMRDSSYESAEASTGNRITIMNEYLHYFSMFIAFEILVVIILVWSPVARLIPFMQNAAILSLLVLGMVLEAFVMLIARARW